MTPPPRQKPFSDLSLKSELLETLKDLEFKTMTPIQEKSLPHILKSQDIIAQAKTGSGKTAAFALGFLNSLDVNSEQIQALVLCPTRELAEQVATETRTLARKLKNVQVLSLCGGVPESVQQKSLLSKPHIAVGTPGRVLQLLKKEALDLNALRVFTLDEADKMLDMGFLEDIEEIASYLPKKCQALLFSATYPEDILSLSQRIQNNAVEIKVDTTHEENNIEQFFFETKQGQDKNDFLYKILSHYRPDRIIVFCRTKKDTADIADFLLNRKIAAECLNGDLEQSERTEVLTKFSNHSLSVLVATDVAARGLDIEDLTAVFNYDLPSNAESYIHRVGRTGRAGKKGLAFSFFDDYHDELLEQIEGLTLKKCHVQDVSKLSFEKKYNLIPPMQTLYITGGKKQKLRPGDILGALTGDVGLDAKDIGQISIHNAFSSWAL